MNSQSMTAAEARVLRADAARVRAQQPDAQVIELPQHQGHDDVAVAS